MPASSDSVDGCSAWNPGIGPEIPPEYRPLETLFRPESVTTGLAEVLELARLTGLRHEELVAFRPDRLLLHELIVRVTAEIVVAEGPEEEVFGHNFRAIVAALWRDEVAPRLESLREGHAALLAHADARAGEILDATLFRPAETPAPPPRRFPFRLFAADPAPAAAPDETPQERDRRVVAGFRERARSCDDPFERALLRSLHRVLGCMATTRGWIGTDRALLCRLARVHFGNTFGSQALGEQLDPLVDAAIARAGYTRVRSDAAPVLISLKGASAAGKSSLRPMLKEVMRAQGIAADGYATISPDVWRRALLDYEGLGPACKYAGPLTSREVMVIDGKLDRYIRRRAERDRTVPHLLVDRFRFDSFASEQVGRVLHNTYAKYVDTMYMYFVITAPEETVERGWRRGLERGRYKAVEDFLGHSVEAYVGMPRLLFKWLSYDRPRFRYFFLDNMVPKGTFPLTVAEGDQQTMRVFRPLGLVAIERYQKIDVHATTPAGVYPPAAELDVERNCGFLRQCLRRIPVVEFVDPTDGTLYARTVDGRFGVVDPERFARVSADAETARLFRALAPAARSASGD